MTGDALASPLVCTSLDQPAHASTTAFAMQECAAVQFTWTPIALLPSSSLGYKLDTQLAGRLRVCTRNVCFEPDDAREPVVKYPLREMPGRPQALSASSAVPRDAVHVSAAVTDAGLQLRDAIAMQPATAVEMKAGGAVAPYRTRILESVAAPASAADGGDAALAGAPRATATAPPPPPVSSRARSLFGGTKAASGSGGTAAAAVSAPPAPAAGKHTPMRPLVVIVLVHTAATSIVPLLERLWTLQAAAATAHSGYERAALEGILGGRRDGPFDLSLLGDFRERPLTPAAPRAVSVERVFPLVTVPGRLLLTERSLYIAPVSLNNVAGADAVAKWPLRDVRRVLRRRRLLCETGLELLLAEDVPSATSAAAASAAAAAGLRPATTGAGGLPTTVFLSFADEATRDEVYRLLLAQLRELRPGGAGGGSAGGGGARGRGAATATAAAAAASGSPASPSQWHDDALGDPTPDALRRLTRAWQSRALSTLDYLLALNSAAGRTAADLTQYPVLPWVLADYTSPTLDLADPATYRDLSKPIGALNEKRLAAVRRRFRDMPPDDPAVGAPFMYGTHYSAPGYCLHFLVRAMPEHMLRLQSGRFDAPDRAFFDVAASWAGVTSVNMDVKELTPEFYASDGAFLCAPPGLDLGVRQNGRRVGDVVLPPWASDAGDFVARCREALEGDVASAAVHAWVDLIFGHKQRGPAAVAADNVFYYLTYEGAVDAASLADPDRRAALQSQIAEFGQTPRQLFTEPHPSRGGPPAPWRTLTDGGGGGGGGEPAVRGSDDIVAEAEPAAAATAMSAQPTTFLVEVTPASATSDAVAATAHVAVTPSDGGVATADDDGAVGVACALRAVAGAAGGGVGTVDADDAGTERPSLRSLSWTRVAFDGAAVVAAPPQANGGPVLDGSARVGDGGVRAAPTWAAGTSIADAVCVSDSLLEVSCDGGAGMASGVTGVAISSCALAGPAPKSWGVDIIAATADGRVTAVELVVDGVGDGSVVARPARAAVVVVPSPAPASEGSAVLAQRLHAAVVLQLVAAGALARGGAASLPGVPLTGVASSRDGRVAFAACADGRAYLVDVARGAVIAVVAPGDSGSDDDLGPAVSAAVGPRSPATCVALWEPAVAAGGDNARWAAASQGGRRPADVGGDAAVTGTLVAVVGRADGSIAVTPVTLRALASGDVAAVVGATAVSLGAVGASPSSTARAVACVSVIDAAADRSAGGANERGGRTAATQSSLWQLWVAAGLVDGTAVLARFMVPRVGNDAAPPDRKVGGAHEVLPLHVLGPLCAAPAPAPGGFGEAAALRGGGGSGVVAARWLPEHAREERGTGAPVSGPGASPLRRRRLLMATADGALHVLAAECGASGMPDLHWCAGLATGRPLRCVDVDDAGGHVAVAGDGDGGVALWDVAPLLVASSGANGADGDHANADGVLRGPLLPAVAGRPVELRAPASAGTRSVGAATLAVAVRMLPGGRGAVVVAAFGGGGVLAWAGQTTQ